MSVVATNLIPAQFASNADVTYYTAPSAVIIDKFTVTNTDASARTVTVNLVTSGGAVGTSNTITKDYSISAGASVELSELKNHVLSTGEMISVKASVSSVVVIRASGRVIT